MSTQPDAKSAPRWRRLWQTGWLVVAVVALALPALAFVVLDTPEHAPLVALLFVGLAALGARSSLITWLDMRERAPAIGRWILAGVLLGAVMALIGGMMAAFWLAAATGIFTMLAVAALVLLSLVHLQVRGRRKQTRYTLLATTGLNSTIAYAAGYEITFALTSVFGGGAAVALLALLLGMLCGAGIGGWRYVV
jgi:hypothetical protein